MEAIIVNTVIGAVTLLFAAMAFAPLILSTDSRQTPIRVEEDRIISVETIPFDRPATRSITPITGNGDSHPHREAA